jgi:N-acetylmuramoyl-L-alanine amidase
MPQEGNEGTADVPVGTGNYEVKQGECLYSIAAQHGFFWETLWQASENSELRSKRADPGLLYPGDLVFLPERQLKEESAAAGQRHSFRWRGVPAQVKVRLLDNGVPCANTAWKANVSGVWVEGSTDGDGLLKLTLSPGCEKVLLRLQNGREFHLALRQLDPVDTTTGVQARLNNLGYWCGTVDGVQGPLTTKALKEFQQDNPPLKVDGIAGPKTQAKLKEVYGC